MTLELRFFASFFRYAVSYLDLRDVIQFWLASPHLMNVFDGFFNLKFSKPLKKVQQTKLILPQRSRSLKLVYFQILTNVYINFF